MRNYEIISIIALVLLATIDFSCRDRSPYYPTKKQLRGYKKIQTELQSDNERCNKFYKMVHDYLYLRKGDSCKITTSILNGRPSDPWCIQGLTKREVTLLFGPPSCIIDGKDSYVFSTRCDSNDLRTTYITLRISYMNDTVSSINKSSFGWVE